MGAAVGAGIGRDWGSWVRYGLTAGGSFVAGVVALTIAAADVKANAARGAALAPRVDEIESTAKTDRAEIARSVKAVEDQTKVLVAVALRVATLENHEAEDRANDSARARLLDEVRQDVKELLRRTK